MSFEKYRKSLVPTSLSRQAGLDWQEVLGRLEDEIVAKAKSAILIRYPRNAQDDSLAAIGDDRVLEKAPWGESSDRYRGRLLRAFEYWSRAGNPHALVEVLESIGAENGENRPFATIRLQEESGVPRAFLILGKPHPWGPLFWSDSETRLWDDNELGTWGSTARVTHVNWLRRFLAAFKAARAHIHIIVILDESVVEAHPNLSPEELEELGGIVFWKTVR